MNEGIDQTWTLDGAVPSPPDDTGAGSHDDDGK
jgi:hypothetical protein